VKPFVRNPGIQKSAALPFHMHINTLKKASNAFFSRCKFAKRPRATRENAGATTGCDTSALNHRDTSFQTALDEVKRYIGRGPGTAASHVVRRQVSHAVGEDDYMARSSDKCVGCEGRWLHTRSDPCTLKPETTTPIRNERNSSHQLPKDAANAANL
jgi:hypothetical protein